MENEEEIKKNFLSKAETFYYGCDGGALGITINGIDANVLNCTGDGEGIVYIVKKSHFTLPSPFDSELILTLKSDELMTLGLKEYDLDYTPILFKCEKRFEIYRIKDTKNFIIRIG